MGRAPCCEKDSVKRGPWTPEEDAKLMACIGQHGTGSWRTLPKKAGLQRCGKSCRLRWTNYLRPDLKHGRFTDHEEQLIVNLHAALGSRWSLIAAQLPGRTDNDVKNYWNTRLKKKLCEMGIDPITHKPISQLLADLAGSMALPKGGEIAEAALGCFKDDMLNVLMRKRPDWQLEGSMGGNGNPRTSGTNGRQSWSDLVATTSQMPRGTASPKSVLSTAYESGSLSDQRCGSDPSSARMSEAVVQKIKYSLTKAVQSNVPGTSVQGMHVVGNAGSNPTSPHCNGTMMGDPNSGFLKADQYSHNMAVAAMRSRFSGEATQNYSIPAHQFISLGPGVGGSEAASKAVMDMFMDPQGVNARTSMGIMPNMEGMEYQMQPQSLCKGLSGWGGNLPGSSPPTSLGLHLPSSPVQEHHHQAQNQGFRSFLDLHESHDRQAGLYGQTAAMQVPQHGQLVQQELLISSFGKPRTDIEEQDMGQGGRSSPPASPSESGCSPSQSQNMQIADSSDLGKKDGSPNQEDSKNPWSPSASGSSCSSTSLAAADAAIDGVLSSDVLLWDFSELGSIIN